MVTINVGPDRPEIKPSTRPSQKVRKTQNYFVLRQPTGLAPLFRAVVARQRAPSTHGELR